MRQTFFPKRKFFMTIAIPFSALLLTRNYFTFSNETLNKHLIEKKTNKYSIYPQAENSLAWKTISQLSKPDLSDDKWFSLELEFQENSFLNPDLIKKKESKQKICTNLDDISKKFISDPNKSDKRPILRFNIDCISDIIEKEIGYGSWLAAFYGIRLAAMSHGGSDIEIRCERKRIQYEKNYILPWLMGYWPELQNETKAFFKLPEVTKACANYDESPMEYMISFMQFELRRMAIMVVGIPHKNHHSAQFAQQYLSQNSTNHFEIPNSKQNDSPTISGMEIDDVAIQFTCGIILSGKSKPNFYFFKFLKYKENISPDTSSIGIFIRDKNNKNCMPYVEALEEYLQNAFPNARVKIREETPLVTYSLLIMANQTFVGPTLFGAFPAIAAFGTAYMPDPKLEESQNQWIIKVNEKWRNLHFIKDDDFLLQYPMKKMFRKQTFAKERILYWLKTDDALVHHPYPPEETIEYKDIIVRNSNLIYNSYWEESFDSQRICPHMDLLASQQKGALVNFTINCNSYFKDSELGTGNWISAIYGIRLAALTRGDVGVYMVCDDADDEKINLILPWLMGYWPARKEEEEFPWPHPDSYPKSLGLPSLEDACGNYDRCPIGYMTPFIRYELRRMAIAVGGIPNTHHPSSDYAKRYLWSNKINSKDRYQLPGPRAGDEPLVPDLKFDDVAIHFRCGDIMGNSNHPSFGFMKFTAYKKWISPEASSIGIISNPIDPTAQDRFHHRMNDSLRERCGIVLHSLKKYLEEAFPRAKVILRVDAKETITTSYTRLIMANQTFASISSFGAFPVVATFGTGYIKKPDFRKVPNKWIPHVSSMYNDVVMMDEKERLMAEDVNKMLRGENGMEKIVHWFTTEDFKTHDEYIPSSEENKMDLIVDKVESNENVIERKRVEMIAFLQDIIHLSSLSIEQKQWKSFLEANPPSPETFIMNLDLLESSYWNQQQSGQPLCPYMDLLASQQKGALVNFTINCNSYFKDSELGTGNWISAIYGIRLAALTRGDVGVYMVCDDADDEKINLILPWLMGYWPARKEEEEFPWPHPDSYPKSLGLPSLEDACGNYDRCPIGYMTPFIRYELRRMAIAVGGIPNTHHPSSDYAKRYLWSNKINSKDRYQLPGPRAGDEPLVPDLKFDDVAIHFRCGDIMGNSNHPSFGFMKFTAYKKWISPEASSIGIISNPIDPTAQDRFHHRMNDSLRERCGIVLHSLKKYLEEAFPRAKVILRVDAKETITTSYTRLIMANQTFASISSFGAFPVVATFGTGYIKKPDFRKVPNKWIPHVSSMYNDVVMMDEKERLMAEDVNKMLRGENGMEKIVHWFTTEDFKTHDEYIPSSEENKIE